MVHRVAELLQRKHFYDDLRSECDLHSLGELVLGMSDFNERVGKRIEGYEYVHGRNGIGREKYGRKDVRVL